jgi:hypothetical protein
MNESGSEESGWDGVETVTWHVNESNPCVADAQVRYSIVCLDRLDRTERGFG